MVPINRDLPKKALDAAGIDPWILGSVLLLCGIGLITVLSASTAPAEGRYNDPQYLFKRQAVYMGLGLAVMVVCRFIKTDLYRRLSYPILMVCAGLMILVFVPGIGRTVGGNTSWLRFAGLSLQPSEIVKLGLVVYLAYSMAKKVEVMASFTVGVLPHLIVGGLFVGMTLLQRDLGMAAILSLLLGVVLFLGGARLSQLFVLGSGVVALGVYQIIQSPNRLARIATYADPWADPSGASFQIRHSFLAFGSGGLFGSGIGGSHMRLGFLPEPHTDFIFAILAEELGFIGVSLVVTLFFLVAWRGFMLAAKAQDLFQRYLAAGMTLIIVLQALANMAVVLGLIPTTGITLPFLSYGGTALVVNLTATGVLLRLSMELREA